MEFCVVLTPLFHLWQACGLAPVSVICCRHRKNLWKKLVTPSFFWFLIVLCFTAVSINARRDSFNFPKQHPIGFVKVLLYLLLSTSLLLLLGICTNTELEHLQCFVRKLKCADLHLLPKEEGNGKVMGSLLLAISSVMAVGALATSAVECVGLNVFLYDVFVSFYDFMITLQFVLLVLELWTRLRTLNSRLQEALPEPLYSPPMGVRLSPPASPRLSHLLVAYMALRRAAKFLQSHFGLIVVFLVANQVCLAMCNAYELFLILLRPRSISEFCFYMTPASASINFIYTCFKLTLMALSCGALKDAGATTSELLLDASVSHQWRCPYLESFQKLTAQGPPLCFSAAGFFTVDRSMLASALTIIATYLVVLGQFTPTE